MCVCVCVWVCLGVCACVCVCIHKHSGCDIRQQTHLATHHQVLLQLSPSLLQELLVHVPHRLSRWKRCSKTAIKLLQLLVQGNKFPKAPRGHDM